MGNVFSCLASAFLWLGDLFENVALAMGELAAVLVRGAFGILVSFCDILAAISCCWRVPWDERPDRPSYKYQNAFVAVGNKQVLNDVFTKDGRAKRKQIKEAQKKEKALKAEAVVKAKAEKKQAEQEKKTETAVQAHVTTTDKAAAKNAPTETATQQPTGTSAEAQV